MGRYVVRTEDAQNHVEVNFLFFLFQQDRTKKELLLTEIHLMIALRETFLGNRLAATVCSPKVNLSMRD